MTRENPRAPYEFTNRGFKYYKPIRTTSDHEVSVYESSAAEAPHIWLSVRGRASWDKDPDRATAPLNAHLNVEQAEALRDTIDAALAQHYQCDAPPCAGLT